MRPYDLTPDADADLENIARYTLVEWGEEQAERYLDRIEKQFLMIADRQIVPRQFSTRFPQVLVTRCQRHYIFYLHPEGEKPHIIAVLHERMDMIAKISHRLSA
jgi:plasmid stabilization system protein ParE